MGSVVLKDAPRPRLCHMTTWQHFDGYGFRLHAEKRKAGQRIGKVDSGSPAEAAGLNEGDSVIEVNGANIGNENHMQVVRRIKALPDELSLLVLDSEAAEYYSQMKITVHGDMPNVQHLTSDQEESLVKSHKPQPTKDAEAKHTRAGNCARLQPMASAGVNVVPGAPLRHGYSPVNPGDRVTQDLPGTGAESNTVPVDNPMTSAPPSYHAVITTNRYPPPAPTAAVEPVPSAPVDDTDGPLPPPSYDSVIKNTYG